MPGAPSRTISRLARLPGLEARLTAVLPASLARPLLRRRHRLAVRGAVEAPNPPVLVYAMSKVASSAVLEALQAAGLNVFRAHVISERGVRRLRAAVHRRGLTEAGREVDDLEDFARALDEELVRPGHPLKVVTLVREPIARNVSYYFQILDDLWQTADAHDKVPMGRLLAEYEERFEHGRVLEWFDEEFAPTLGVDVYAHAFPREAGFLRIESGPYEVLVMRHDLDDRLKGKLLAELVGAPAVTVAPRNVGARKPYAASYREFLGRVSLREEYVDRMLDSKYARHFYAPEELARVRARWLGARRPEYV